MIDGEAVIWTDGRLDFAVLQKRLTTSRKNLSALVNERPASFVAFDLLQAAGTDTRGLVLRGPARASGGTGVWREPSPEPLPPPPPT